MLIIIVEDSALMCLKPPSGMAVLSILKPQLDMHVL